jgi:hypothetical protein
MRFGTMSARTAFRFPRTRWLPSSLRNPPPVQKEKPSSSKGEGAVNSAGSVEGISRDLLVSLLVSSKRTLSILLHNR